MWTQLRRYTRYDRTHWEGVRATVWRSVMLRRRAMWRLVTAFLPVSALQSVVVSTSLWQWLCLLLSSPALT
jgi:hypothetical protein